jgi:hypothetical protein
MAFPGSLHPLARLLGITEIDCVACAISIQSGIPHGGQGLYGGRAVDVAANHRGAFRSEPKGRFSPLTTADSRNQRHLAGQALRGGGRRRLAHAHQVRQSLGGV